MIGTDKQITKYEQLYEVVIFHADEDDDPILIPKSEIGAVYQQLEDADVKFIRLGDDMYNKASINKVVKFKKSSDIQKWRAKKKQFNSNQ